MTTQQALQALVLAVTLLALGATWVFVRRHPDEWAYAVPPAAWLLHLIIFYGCIFWRDFANGPHLDFTFWSTVVRLQAAFLILGGMLLLACEQLIFNRHHDQ